MFAFTKQERLVLSLFVLIIFFGSILQYSFKKFHGLRDMVNLIDSDKVYKKINLNTAPMEELVGIPYIGEYTAANIIQYRQEHGPFTSIEQVKEVKGIRDKNYEKFYRHLKI